MSFIDEITSLKYSETGEPATDKEIKDAEIELQVKFASDYDDYLRECGSLSWYGHILTGISKFPGVDVVKVTKEAREYNPQVPPEMYVIEEAHIDGIIVWQDPAGFIYQSMPNVKPVKVAGSLLEYIHKED